MSYKSFFDEMTIHFLFEPWSEEIVQYLDVEFKRRYPGNYSVEWKCDEFNNYLVDCKLTFDKPEDETMFLLKYL